MAKIIKLVDRKVKFDAINRKIAVLGNCHYLDLGESVDFEKSVREALKNSLPPETFNLYEPSFKPRTKTADGYCHKLTLQYNTGDEKYAFVVYRPNRLERYWFVRGHEEGEALLYFGLENEIERMIDAKIKKNNKERIADLCGMEALKIRYLDHFLSPRVRAYHSMAKIK